MTKNSIYFSLVLHFHQPVGNFDHVFARAYDLAYKPLLDHLWSYPDIRVGMHFPDVFWTGSWSTGLRFMIRWIVWSAGVRWKS